MPYQRIKDGEVIAEKQTKPQTDEQFRDSKLARIALQNKEVAQVNRPQDKASPAARQPSAKTSGNHKPAA